MMPLWLVIGYWFGFMVTFIAACIIEKIDDKPDDEALVLIVLASFFWPLLIIFAPITAAVAVSWRRGRRKPLPRAIVHKGDK